MKETEEIRKVVGEIGRIAKERQERIKSATPEAPDGSGKKGAYDGLLSHYIRRPVYRTEDNTFFYPSGDVFKIIDEDLLENAREHILKYEDIDILDREDRKEK